MSAILLALSSRGIAPGAPDETTVLVSFVVALACTFGVGWYARRLDETARRRDLDALVEATPVGGIH